MDAALASSRILDDHPILLLTVHLPDGDVCACDQTEDVISRGITFLKGVGIERPQDDGKPVKSLLTIANVGNKVANLIEMMDIAVSATLELVMASDPDEVVQAHRGLVIRAAETGKSISSFSLVQDIPVDEPVSGLRASSDHFPGVVYAFEKPARDHVERFLGIPWVLNGAQRTGADCWGLVRLVYASQGLEIRHPSEVPVDRAAEIARRFREVRELVLGDIAFEPAEAPWLDWDILEMSHEADTPNHVGVVVHLAGRPMMLHSRRGVGSHLTAIAELPHRILGGWRHV